MGFRLFGQYRNVQDDNPSAVGSFRASEALINQLEANPVTSFNGTNFSSAQFLGENELPTLSSTNPREADRDYNISLKFDTRLSKNIDFTVSGTVFDSENLFTPSLAWGLYNWTNNPVAYSGGYRGNVRIRHKLGLE